MAETVTVTLEHGGCSFSFQLCRRELDFGAAGRAPYYWMDGRQFRHQNPGTNFRACVDLWWTAVEEAGAAGSIDNQVNLVLAESYPLVNTARSLQDVYVDAHLHKKADRRATAVEEKGCRPVDSERTYSLPKEEVARLQQLATYRDARRIRAELEELFLGEMPSSEAMPAFQKAVRAWIGNGIVALRKGGRSALREYVAEVGNWIRKYRKQGHQDRARRFVNTFGYECKVAFYLCHTSAWNGLVKRLVADGRLPVTGERFMRLWHHQNQPADDNGGVIGGARDVFCGQVLSLHPLSAIVLNEPCYLAIIGRWLGHPDYDALHQANGVATCPEYWEVVAMILVAAHEYDHAREHWDATRGRVTYGGTAAAYDAARDDATASVALLFEDYAAGRRLVCPECKQKLSYSCHEPSKDGEDWVLVRFRCPSGHDHSVPITHEELLQPNPVE
jgi:hypothetical protein